MTGTLQAVDLSPLLVYVLPLALLLGLYLLFVFGMLPRRVERLERRVEGLEARVGEDTEDDR